MSNSSIWPIDRTLSGVNIPDQNKPGSNGNEGILQIYQSSNITWASPSDGLVTYIGLSLVGVLPLCRDAVSIFYNSSQLGYSNLSTSLPNDEI